jgi:hypothetical protein
MYRLKFASTRSYKYDTKTNDFELHFDGDIIKVSSFSLAQRAHRLVELAKLNLQSSSSRRAVTRAMMILLAQGFASKREGDRLVDEIMAPEEVREHAKGILTEIFYRKAEVPPPRVAPG